MTITLKHLSLLIASALILCIGCEPDSKVHVLSDPTDEPIVSESEQQSETEPAKAEPAVPEMPAEVAEPEEEMMQSVEIQTQEASPDEVAVTVNGVEITEGKLDEMIKPQLDRMLARTRGRQRPEGFIEDTKKRLRSQAIEGAIIETLVEQDLEKNNIVITEEQINQHIQEMADQQNMTVDDLKGLIEASGRTFDEWKKQMQFDKRLAVVELIKSRGLGDLEVTDAEALEYYNNNLQRYETPEQVQASHILIKPDTSDPGADPALADAKALEKAQALLEQIKNGADFAELAMANSDCPSGKNGGDLGFGQRRTWVGPFSDAAFALQPGEISDIVKTRFGYHIIKCTDRKDAGTQSFDEVKNDITNMLRAQKHQELMMKYFDLIKSEANIVYPPGKEPEEMTPPM